MTNTSFEVESRNNARAMARAMKSGGFAPRVYRPNGAVNIDGDMEHWEEEKNASPQMLTGDIIPQPTQWGGAWYWMAEGEEGRKAFFPHLWEECRLCGIVPHRAFLFDSPSQDGFVRFIDTGLTEAEVKKREEALRRHLAAAA